MTKHWPYLVIILLLILLLLRDLSCNDQGTNSGNTDTIRIETVHKYDTVIHEIHTHKIYYSDTGKLILPPVVDSSAAVKDYYTEHPFVDSLSNDSIDITYSGTIWKGSMFNPSVKYLWKMPTTTIINTVLESPPPRFKMYAGAYGVIAGEPAFGGMLSLQNRHDDIFSIGAGYPKSVMLQAQFKIRLQKRK